MNKFGPLDPFSIQWFKQYKILIKYKWRRYKTSLCRNAKFALETKRLSATILQVHCPFYCEYFSSLLCATLSTSMSISRISNAEINTLTATVTTIRHMQMSFQRFAFLWSCSLFMFTPDPKNTQISPWITWKVTNFEIKIQPIKNLILLVSFLQMFFFQFNPLTHTFLKKFIYLRMNLKSNFRNSKWR